MQAMAGTMWALGAANKAPAFVPTDLANLALWLKADALTLNDGDAVSTWTDSSGNSRHATQTLTARPTYKTNIVNGKPVLRFDGSNDYMVTPAVFASNTAFTLFVVSSALGSSLNSGGRAVATIRPALGSVNGFMHYLLRSNLFNNARIFTASDGNSADGVTLYPSTSYPFDSWVISSHVYGSNSTWFLNGAQKAQGANVAAQVNAGAILHIGTYFFATPTQYYFSGDFAELILYGSALNDTDRGSVQTYLASKYGITLA